MVPSGYILDSYLKECSENIRVLRHLDKENEVTASIKSAKAVLARINQVYRSLIETRTKQNKIKNLGEMLGQSADKNNKRLIVEISRKYERSDKYLG